MTHCVHGVAAVSGGGGRNDGRWVEQIMQPISYADIQLYGAWSAQFYVHTSSGGTVILQRLSIIRNQVYIINSR